MKTIFVLMLCAGAARAEWQPPTRVDVGLLLFAEALIVVDGAQTVHACSAPYAIRCEVGLGMLVMGTKPSTEQIVRVSVAAGLSTAVLWYVLPPPWRKGFIVGLTVGEGLNVAANFAF